MGGHFMGLTGWEAPAEALTPGRGGLALGLLFVALAEIWPQDCVHRPGSPHSEAPFLALSVQLECDRVRLAFGKPCPVPRQAVLSRGPRGGQGAGGGQVRAWGPAAVLTSPLLPGSGAPPVSSLWVLWGWGT